MRAFSVVCLVSLVVATSLAEPVEAGRRGRRRAAVAVGIVAATARRPVAVAATVVARPTVARPTYAVLTPMPTPDLTITEISTEGHLQCVTVKNIGQATSPETHLQIDFLRFSDGVLVATKRVRVLPLQVNQFVRFRLRSLPGGHVEVVAWVDPDHLVVESNERNNNMRIGIIPPPPVAEPVALEDVEVWIVPEVPRDETGGGPAGNNPQE